MSRVALALLLLPVLACGAPPDRVAPPRFAIALHGGAGVIPRDTPPAEREAYLQGLQAALREGRDRLARGEPALDVVEAVVRLLEDDPQFNAGKGAVFTEDGRHELDASIMDGSTLACGAVAGVSTVRHPVTLARLVMERTPHVLLAGEGAERFADAAGVERVENAWFDTPRRRAALERFLQERDAQADSADAARGTVGCVALDVHGHLAAATSTGGMTGKRFGRVGDAPIIGAGTYADDASCAVSCTGTGEEFMRHVASHEVAALVRHAGLPLAEAARTVVFERLRPGDGGLIAVSRAGEIALVFSTPGMFRGAADSEGRFEVGIWEGE